MAALMAGDGAISIEERTLDVDISNFNHLRGDGIYRCSGHASDPYSGPGASLSRASNQDFPLPSVANLNQFGHLLLTTQSFARSFF
jgi:hypothetical protein